MPKEFRYDSVGRCIYCGKTAEEIKPKQLSDEHIIPLGLGGLRVLPKSSCDVCARKTCSFETHVLQGMYGLMRGKDNFPSRRPKDRPTHLNVKVELHSGAKSMASIPLEGIPGAIPLIHYNPPGLLRTPPPVSDVTDPVSRHEFVPLRFDRRQWEPSYTAVASPGIRVDPLSLARMLGKIAHSYCVAEYGIDSFEHWLPPIILGETSNYGVYVGGVPDIVPNPLDLNSPEFQIKVITFDYWKWNVLVVFISYFATVGNSANCVVVGSTTDKFPRSRFIKYS